MKKKFFVAYCLLSTTYCFSQTQSNISYGADNLQKLDYWTAASPNSPIVVVIHGGGWFTGDKNGTPYKNAAQLFNNEGYAVVNINYRLTPNVTYPEHIEDLVCALAWTKNNAASLNGDSGRIALYGHSAGGQIAAYLGVRPLNAMLSGCSNTSGLNVDAVLLTSATVDFDMTNPNNWTPIKNMLGDSALYWNIAQPMNHCFNNFDTKFLILCGESDDLWIGQDSVFYDSLTFYSHCSYLQMFSGNDHNSLLDNLTSTNAVWITMRDFLDSLWNGNLCQNPTANQNIDFQKENFIQVFPNPFSHTLQITNVGELRITKLELNIFDVMGKMVFQKTLNSKIETLNLDLPNGIYFYKVLNNKIPTGQGKFVIQ